MDGRSSGPGGRSYRLVSAGLQLDRVADPCPGHDGGSWARRSGSPVLLPDGAALFWNDGFWFFPGHCPPGRPFFICRIADLQSADRRVYRAHLKTWRRAVEPQSKRSPAVCGWPCGCTTSRSACRMAGRFRFDLTRHSIGSALRLTEPRSGKFARPARIWTDTDRVQLCATSRAPNPRTSRRYPSMNGRRSLGVERATQT